MKRILSYALTFMAGSLLSGTVAMAATTMVQAQKGTSNMILNGKTVEQPPKLVYGGTTYVQLYSIEQALKQAGFSVGWDGTNFTMRSPAAYPIGPVGTSSQIIGMSQLPYTFNAQDGMVVTVKSIVATAQQTVISFTVGNNGKNSSADAAMSFFGSSLSDGGTAVPLISDADYNDQGALGLEYSDLHPGQEIDNTITYGPLKTGVTQFTWYFQDFSGNTQSVSFDLSK